MLEPEPDVDPDGIVMMTLEGLTAPGPVAVRETGTEMAVPVEKLMDAVTVKAEVLLPSALMLAGLAEMLKLLA